MYLTNRYQLLYKYYEIRNVDKYKKKGKYNSILFKRHLGYTKLTKHLISGRASPRRIKLKTTLSV